MSEQSKTEQLAIVALVSEVASHFLALGKTLAVVESCTGGGLGSTLTALPGASAWFEGGFITYSNKAKMKHVYVRESTLQESGAVSEDCVKEMANGAMISMDTDCAISISGVAGPDGGSPEKPVGTVWVGVAVRFKSIEAHEFHFQGDREAIRQQSIVEALKLLKLVSFSNRAR